MTRIGVDEGIGGWYAVAYDRDGYIQTGIGRYGTRAEAEAEAMEWAESEGIPTDVGFCRTPSEIAKATK